MANLANFHKHKKHSFFASLGHKIKAALEIGATAKGLFDMGRGVYQGVSAYGPMVYNGLRAVGPMAATAVLL